MHPWLLNTYHVFNMVCYHVKRYHENTMSGSGDPVPQNAESCASGCLHCLPVVNTFRRELTNGVLRTVEDIFLFFFNNSYHEDDVALSELLIVPDVCCIYYAQGHIKG